MLKCLFLGPAFSNALVNKGITSFEKLAETNPREIELVSFVTCFTSLY